MESSFSLLQKYLGALCNRLVKLDEQGVTVPDLAEEWSAPPTASH
jgi:peptide/nickel transport system substrate-binding protein